MRALLKERPDLLLLHESPAIPEQGLQGSRVVRSVLDEGSDYLVICGHNHWAPPLVALAGGQILNVDAKVVILCVRSNGRV